MYKLKYNYVTDNRTFKSGTIIKIDSVSDTTVYTDQFSIGIEAFKLIAKKIKSNVVKKKTVYSSFPPFD